jgi:hypothetical protein
VLNKKDVELGPKDKVSVQQFIDAWRGLGVLVASSSAAAIYNKYGQDINGKLPVMVSASSLDSTCRGAGMLPHTVQLASCMLLALPTKHGSRHQLST